MAKYNIENEQAEIYIGRLFKYSPELVYSVWADVNLLKQWFMTSQRTNKLFDIDIHEGGQYRVIDARNGKQNIIQGKYEELVSGEHIRMTIRMPGLSDSQNAIKVESEERESDGMQMPFYYQSIIEKECRLTALEYKHKKKEYRDSTAHGPELMSDRTNEALDQYIEDNDMLL